MGARRFGRAAVILITSCGLLVAAGIAVAAPGGQQGRSKPAHPVHPTKPANGPPAVKLKATAPSTRSTGGTGRTARKPTPNGGARTGGGAAKDPRDPGSAQERGRGNSGDIDPFRGPDAAGNDPPRGNDCDEGGGNNRGSFPRRENAAKGDSPVDNDRGRGNNRCGASAAAKPPPERIPPSQANPPQQPGPTAGQLPAGGVLPGQVGAGAPGGPGSEPGGGGAERPVLKLGPARVRLPFTGAELLWLALLGSLLSALGLGLRRALAGGGKRAFEAVPAAPTSAALGPALDMPRPAPAAAPAPGGGRAASVVRLALLGATAGGIAVALRRLSGD
jgi:hypothetical protein